MGLVALLAFLGFLSPPARASREPPPNVVLIVADDLGFGDPGVYGQRVIPTPQIDRMASEGLRFTDFYAGSTVCAPSRCVLMTGLHTGHCTVRGNGGVRRQALRDEDVTIAERLRSAGYTCAMYGKWGLGEPGTPGLPQLQGFDDFLGYLGQLHAHNHFPEFLLGCDASGVRQVGLPNVLRRDGERYEAVGAGTAEKKIAYSHDRFVEEALAFLRRNADRPFFLYLPFTLPHANNEAARLTGNGQEVPDYGPFENEDWPDADKGQAAMIWRLDRDTGRILDEIDALGLGERTLVMFTSDNGPHREGGQDIDRFDPNGPLRGIKRDLYEGGIRVPLIARWTGRVPGGRVTRHIASFADVTNTLLELAGLGPAPGLDSLSFAPTLLGRERDQPRHDYLYFEFHERKTAQAARKGRFKAVRSPIGSGPLELYDLDLDQGETRDVASKHPRIAAEMAAILDRARTPSERWPVPADRARTIRER